MENIDLKKLTLDDYPLTTYDKIRYGDTDRQDHVNNAVFATFLETGRTELLYNPDQPLYSEGGSFVIAKLNLNLLAELKWPGKVEIGTAIKDIGSSSVKIVQSLYQKGKVAATAETVIVHIDKEENKSKPLSEEAKVTLNKYKLEK
ncbi:MAG TPA: thioesterase family protein [Halanaerobiales bacterium]|nr:thioesterase family protein [Halanaerobiales bacterium]